MAKAMAFLAKREYVIPEDVEAIFTDVARHRIVLGTKARVSGVREEAVLKEILTQVRPPVTYKERRERK